MVSSRKEVEIDTLNSHALISWRSIAAGLLIALFTMTGLIGLGLAFGGISMDEATSAKNVGIFTGIWFIVSTILSLFVGSYYAARVSKFRMGRIGSAQGLVIAALFLGFFLYQTISAIGSISSATGAFLGKSGGIIAQGAESASDSPAIMNTISSMSEDALGNLNLKSDPSTVAQGLGTRLLRGDAESAKNYLSFQAGISPAEADTYIAKVKSRVDKFIGDTKEGTATALRSTGWSLFLLVVLGGISAVAGGALGSVANFRKPLISESGSYYRREQQV